MNNTNNTNNAANAKKSSYRLTRSSYRRKIITFGVSVFTSLALIATGFASYVLSTGAEKDKTGNVEVGVVTEASIGVGNITFAEATGDTVSFNPRTEDTSGKVRYDATDVTSTVNYENMSITFSATVSNISILDAITVEMTVPAGVQAAADAGYIVLPECVGEAVTIVDNGTVTTDTTGGDAWTWTVSTQNDGTATFTYTINFAWGDSFGGMNPGDYFDSTDFVLPEGETESEYIKGELYNFRALVLMNKTYGELTEGEIAELAAKTAVTEKFEVTVRATVN